MPKQSKQLLNKVRNSLNMAVDGLGDTSTDGATAMSKLITKALKEDVVGTLKALSSFFPKDINVDVTHNQSSQHLSDDELADIIATRARQRLEAAKEVEGEIIETIEESTG